VSVCLELSFIVSIFVAYVCSYWQFVIMNRKTRDTGCDYTVVVLGDKQPGDDLEDCMKVRCTNKRSLEVITEISYDRIVYLFGKLKRSYLVEKGNMIIKTSTVYKGSQPGGLRNKGLYQRGND
jgi:hypothetical protein